MRRQRQGFTAANDAEVPFAIAVLAEEPDALAEAGEELGADFWLARRDGMDVQFSLRRSMGSLLRRSR